MLAQTIPAGSTITVRVGSEISSGTAKAGDRFDATLAHNLVVNGKTSGQSGAPCTGQGGIGQIQRAAACAGELSLRLTAVQVNGKMVPISTRSHLAKGKSHTKSNATKIGGGAAAGR